jgi:hypothetical protein
MLSYNVAYGTCCLRIKFMTCSTIRIKQFFTQDPTADSSQSSMASGAASCADWVKEKNQHKISKINSLSRFMVTHLFHNSIMII